MLILGIVCQLIFHILIVKFQELIDITQLALSISDLCIYAL